MPFAPEVQQLIHRVEQLSERPVHVMEKVDLKANWARRFRKRRRARASGAVQAGIETKLFLSGVHLQREMRNKSGVQ